MENIFVGCSKGESKNLWTLMLTRICVTVCRVQISGIFIMSILNSPEILMIPFERLMMKKTLCLIDIRRCSDKLVTCQMMPNCGTACSLHHLVQ